MEKVALVMMLDHSPSIGKDLALVQIDARAFIRCMLPGDQFGINQFSDTAEWLYPAGTAPQILTVSQSRAETQEADRMIGTMKLGNWTDIGNAILLAQTMLAQSAIQKKALVLLSDGEKNRGPEPLDAYTGSTPIYIAAIGKWAAMEYFAPFKTKNPDCRVYWKPQASDMERMFNDIRGDATGLSVLINEPKEYVGADYHLVNLDVSEDTDLLQVKVTWSDARCHYMEGTPEGLGINVFLIQPDGQRCPEKPNITADAYCIMERRNVTAGKWRVLVQYNIPDTEKKISGVIASFMQSSKLRLQVDVPAMHTKGEPLVVKTAVWDGGRRVENVSAKIRIVRPSALTQNVLLKSKSMLKAVGAADGNKQEQVTTLLGAELERSLHASVCLLEGLPHKGDMTECIDETEYAGPYNIEWEVSGINPSTGKEFSFVKAATVLVGDE